MELLQTLKDRELVQLIQLLKEYSPDELIDAIKEERMERAGEDREDTRRLAHAYGLTE